MSSATEALAIYQELEKPSFLKELAKAIPNTLKPERMVRLVYTVLRKTPALAKCDLKSIMAGVIECAQLGLELGGVLGHADLVPFGAEATLIIGYKGFAHLMYQSGSIVSISAEIVREGDTFKRILGTERRLIHVPRAISVNGKGEADDPESEWLGAYAAVKMISGATEFEYLEKALIYAARAKSSGYRKHLRDGKQSPWVTYPDVIAMWQKTPIRRLAKRMPTSTTDKRADLLRAAMIDEYGERRGLLIPTLSGYQVNDNPPDEDENAGADVQPTEIVGDFVADPGTGFATIDGSPPYDYKPAQSKRSRSAVPPAISRPPQKAPANKNADVLPKARVPRDPIDVTPIKPAAAQIGRASCRERG